MIQSGLRRAVAASAAQAGGGDWIITPIPGYVALIPPSAKRVWPSTQREASAEARNRTGRIVASTGVSSPAGILEARASRKAVFAKATAIRGVSVGPGETALTATPVLAHSTARDLVREITPALLLL
jgi:hypothetical protein